MSVRQFLLPDLGEGLEDAEIVTWRVAEGDAVELNQTLVEVNTAKALVEIPAPWEGVVERLHGGEGDVIKVGEPLVSIRVQPAQGDASEPPAEEAPGAGTERAGSSPEADAKPQRKAVLVGYGVDEEAEVARAVRRRRRPATAPAASTNGTDGAGDADGPAGPVAASPPVRKLAKDLGVDLAAVRGTGPGGRVVREDVTKAAEPMPAFDTSKELGSSDQSSQERMESEILPVTGVRRIIAENVARSARDIPQVTTFLTLDATQLQAFREMLMEATGERVTPLPIVVRSLAEVCREHRKLNASFSAADATIALYRECHVGIATDTDQGLIVTVVRDAQSRGILDIAKEIARLTQAARARTITPRDVMASTITVSNVGSFGAEFGTPIINQNEGAILALGVIEPRALVIEGEVQVRPACTLSLTFDHRLMDGAEAGRALKALRDLLESPFRLGALPR